MKKFLPFSRRQPSLDRYTVNKGGWNRSDGFSVKSMRRISATSLNTKSIQVVRGAYNIDLNKVDASFTKLHRACLMNDDIQVRKHIHKVDNNSHDSSKRYPIHLATVNGNFAIIKLLIDNQANPNVQDNEGNTPLIKSIECGHEHLVKYLLNNGADPNLTDLDNNSALHWALMTESMIAIEALLSSKKCDLSLRNNKDEIPLHLAVRSSLINATTYETLVGGGSDLDATDQLGLAPFDIAQACNNNVAISVLSNYQKQCANSVKKQDNDINHNQGIESHSKPMNICDEYKQQYITKNQENLEYEKRLIQLTAQIERLKVDMNFLREQNEKLESDYSKLSAENSKLKQDNTLLLEQLNKNKHKTTIQMVDGIENINGQCDLLRITSKDIDLEQVDSIECKTHEEFNKTKNFLQERINKLKYGLNGL